MKKSQHQDVASSAAALGVNTQDVLKPFMREPFGGSRRYLAWCLIAILSLSCLVYGFFYAITTPFLLRQFLLPLPPLAALVIWALPDMRRAPLRSVEVLLFAFFVAAIIWPNYLAIALPGLPWITFERLTGIPLVFMLLICTSISPDFRKRLGDTVETIPRLKFLVLAFVVLQIFSIGLSSEPFTSLNAVLSDQISWTAVFFAACYTFLKPGNARLWMYILWGAALFVCGIGIWEQRLGHLPWVGHIPSFLAVGDEYVQRILAGGRRLGTGEYRVQAVHSTSLGLAEFLAMTTPFVLHILIGNSRPPLKALAAASLALIFYVIVATNARLGAVGFFLSCLLYLLAWGVVRWKHYKDSLLGPAVVVAYPVVFVAFFAATFIVHRLKIIVWGGGAAQYSNHGRVEQIQMGIPKILQRPIGYGAGRGAEELGFTNPGGTLTIDNYYLLVALDYGILGFIVYYGAILVCIYAGAKYVVSRRPESGEFSLIIPISISLSVFFVIKSIFSQTHNHSIAFMLMGMLSALLFRAKGDRLQS